ELGEVGEETFEVVRGVEGPREQLLVERIELREVGEVDVRGDEAAKRGRGCCGHGIISVHRRARLSGHVSPTRRSGSAGGRWTVNQTWKTSSQRRSMCGGSPCSAAREQAWAT